MDNYIKNYVPLHHDACEISNVCQFRAKINEFPVSLKVFHINICSIAKNLDELMIFISSLNEQFDIIVLTETFIIYDISIFNIPNYNFLYNASNINRNDGTAVFIRSNLDYQYDICNIGLIKSIQIKLNLNQTDFFITAIYKSQDVNCNEFIENLDVYLRTFPETSCQVLIGDINIDILKQTNVSDEYLNCLYAHGFLSYINKITRVRNQQKSCLDHLFIKSAKKQIKVGSFIYKYKLTDHYPIIGFIEINKPKVESMTATSNNRVYTDYHKMKQKMQVPNFWDSFYLARDVDQATEVLINKINSTLEICTKVVRQTAQNPPKNSWMTKGLLKSVSIKNKMYTQYLQNPTNIDLLNNYKRFKNELTKLIKKVKIQYYGKQVQHISNSSQKLWTLVNNITGNKKQQKTDIKEITINNNTYTDTKEIANAFNKHYSKLGENYANKIVPPST